MTNYQPGEIVDVTIRGARVGGRGIPQSPRCVYIDLGPWNDGVNEGSEYFLTLPVGLDAVTIERVATGDWPPQPGDLWRSGETDRVWFVRKHQPCGDVDCPDDLELVDATGDRYTFGSTVPVALRPLTLVHRESPAVKP